MMDEMEMDGEAYQQMEEMDDDQGMEEEGAEDAGVTFEALRDIVEKTDDEGKDQVVQAREANYISKGTYIWQLLAQIETGE